MSGIIGKNASRSSGVIGTSDVGIASLAADSSPQLGGFLDAAGNYIQMEKGGDIASASPTVIDTDGDYFAVTGTTNFSAFTVAADRHFFLEFGGALTMTHGAGTLDLPGAANITTAASDVGEFFSTAANVVTCVNYTKRDGTAVVLADNSITLAKMAGGTDGNIISYDAAGDPVAIATGDDGQVLTSAGAGAPPVFEDAGGGGLTLGTEVASTSGTTVSFTGIPANTTMVIINFFEVSLSGSDQIRVRLGDSGGIETSGYVSTSIRVEAGPTVTVLAHTLSLTLANSASGQITTGQVVLVLEDAAANTWIASHSMKCSVGQAFFGAGSKASLDSDLTQVQILTSGSDTFDSGAINISYL